MENIQPLPGGRNVTHLEEERELLHQKEEFESAIRSYEGDDPLENWYQFISWVEQSYPKHGLEGNLKHLLEDCLSKFEHDSKYANDVRLCKLFIKFIDLKQNPLEFYEKLHSQGLFRGITNFYQAWAYYHEAVGDFQSAHMVINIGMREMAQPYAELVTANENMIHTAGKQVIFGVNQSRLMNQRQVLTNLSCKSGAGGSIRTSSDASVLPNPKEAYSILRSLDENREATLKYITSVRLQAAPALKPEEIDLRQLLLEPAARERYMRFSKIDAPIEKRDVKTKNKRLRVPVAETQPSVESITQISSEDASNQLSMITEKGADVRNQAEGIVDPVLDINESLNVNVSQQGSQLLNLQEEELFATTEPERSLIEVQMLQKIWSSSTKTSSLWHEVSFVPFTNDSCEKQRTLNTDTLAETGSRGGLHVAAAEGDIEALQQTPNNTTTFETFDKNCDEGFASTPHK